MNAYPKIWVKLHIGTEGLAGDGFWCCASGSAGYSTEYSKVPDDQSDPPGCVWAVEEIRGFGYGSLYARPIVESDEEDCREYQGRYAPSTAV